MIEKKLPTSDYKLLVETVKDYGIFMLDHQGFIQTWNEGAKSIKGYDESEIIGRHFSIFYPPEDIKAHKPEFELQEAIKDGRFEDEGWRIRKDGSRFWANVIITPLIRNGKVLGFSKVTRDLSARKQLENELMKARSALAATLEETQERLSIALDSSHMGIFDWDIANNKVYWSDTMLKIWDYRREDFPATMEGVKERMHPDDRKNFEEAVKKTFKYNEDYYLDYRVIWPDKSIHWINARGRAIRDGSGQVVRFTGTGTDITERKLTEERNSILAEASMIFSSSLEYQKTLKAAALLVVPHFADWIITCLYEGDTLEHFNVYHPDPSLSSLTKKLEDSPIIPRALQEGRTILEPYAEHSSWLSSSNPAQREIIKKLGLGSYISTMLEVRGKVVGGITFIVDQSRAPYQERDKVFAQQFAERAALAIEAGKLYKSAQDAIRVREEVVAIVSHDLRNPLNGVLLNTDLLLRTIPDNEESRQIKIKMERIKRSAQRMRSMIEDILDVTKLESGTFTLEPHLEDVESFVMEVIELHKSLAEEKKITLAVKFSNVNFKIKCDHQRILQVLSNLLGNAIKFTPEGKSITLRVESIEQYVKFSIEDSGPGLSREQIPYIFERYWQAGATQKMGAGLGLFIAKSIVEAHQGKIWVESEEGEGATFIFTLPSF